MTLQKSLATAIAVAAICGFSISNSLAAATVASTAPVITYTATGTFASTPTSGSDTLKLAGEPFSVSIAVSSATAPYNHGPNWAAYNKLKMTGTVHSGLLGPTPVTIASSEASITQAINPNQYDLFSMQAPVKVVGISLTLKAPIALPYGTISNQLLHPFAAVQMGPGNATLTYSDGGSSTTLAIQSGTITGTVPGGASTKSVSALLRPSMNDGLETAGALTAKFYALADVRRKTALV